MNQGIELHDSELAAIHFRGDEAIVSLSPAYIHRTVGRPGVDAGSGWLQAATLTLSGVAPCPAPAMLPATIAGGFLRIDSTQHDNLIPVGGTFTGSIVLSIMLGTGETLTLRGQHIGIQLHGEPTWIEIFNPYSR